MSNPPYMKTYAQEVYTEITNFTLEESGALYRLQRYMWLNGGKVRDDNKNIAMALGVHTNKWKTIRGKIASINEGYLVQIEGGYLTITGMIENYETAIDKRNKLIINGGIGGRGVRGTKSLENNETEKANALANAPPNALANEKQMVNQMLKQLPKPLSSSLSISLTDKDNDTDTREKIVDNFPRRSKNHSTAGPISLAAFLPQASDDGDVASRLEAVFTKHNFPFPLDLHLVHSWIEGGAEFNRDILPTIKGVCERVSRRLLKPPASFAYFQEEVSNAVIKNSKKVI